MDVLPSIFPKLAATLTTGPTGDETFICNKSGKKFIKKSFGKYVS
ncbi:hypothetical protein X471_00562 [Bartonella bacilliformis str. Heidi Mejia]|nr:hypothetical protein X471_00562 [Bartonella bacilliformis str. Heidi Mejia]KEG16544.1 hypothetical protein H705_00414 [Bartonella bacilliformis Cond044]KEG18663.1 hypothetical protein H707_00387 [Bartonella bacilliformis Hosp800-02]KEG23771.1 hypothetical protein H708_00394 [Bartonella bacilliformis VAB9028]KEG24120.1 hypothetical protein H706_00397 [Bartonella bacilliformis CAR600-02]